MSSMEGNNKKEKNNINSAEEEKSSIEINKDGTLEKILKGSLLLYKDSKKGGDCLVMDTPSEENKYKFIFKHEDGSIFKLTKEQLQKLLDNGTVSLMNNQEHLQNLLAKSREYLEKEAKKGSQEHLKDLLRDIRELRGKKNITESESSEKEEVYETDNEKDTDEEKSENSENTESEDKEEEQDPISEEEFNEFVNTGKVSEDIMKEIARRMIEHEKLSDSQLAIYSAPKYKDEKSISEKIEDLIKENNSENIENIESSESKNKKEYKKGSQEHLNTLLLEIEELKEKQQKIKEDLEKNNNINNLLDTEEGEGFQEKMTEMIKLENELKKKNVEKNILEHDLKYGTELQRSKERTWRKPGEAQEAKTTEGIVEDFLQEYRLTEIPEEFNNLTVEQKFFVVRSLKNRVIDIVKSDAQTQYSEELKKKLLNEVKPDKKWKQALSKVKKIGKNMWASVTKEFDMSRIEGEVFKKIRDTEEGKKLIEDNMKLLSEHMSDLKIEYDAEDKDYFYTAYINSENIENCTEEEKNAIKDFNLAANEFAQLPYEWGQLKKSSKKKEYEKIKSEYEKAKTEIYLIKEKRETVDEKGYSMLETMQVDSALQMEQLLNTHPEFEKELSKFRIEADGGGNWKAAGETGVNALHTITGGKGKYNNFTNKALFGAGFLIRMGTKFGTAALTGAKVGGGTLSSKTAYSISTGVGLVAAPVVGAVVGGVKGYYKAKDTLQENKEKARYGERDISNQRTATVDMTSLTNKLNKIVEEIESTENPEEKSKKLALLSVRIDHSMGKIEKGQVNFGTQQALLVNQMKFNEALNKAVILKVSSSKEVNEEIEKRIENSLEYTGATIKYITSAREKEFITKQWKKAALIGAGAATAGYLVRWFGEETGWWGTPHGGESSPSHSNIENTNPSTIKDVITTPKDTSDNLKIPTNPENSNSDILPPPDGGEFTNHADKWVEKATQHINHIDSEHTEKIVQIPIHKSATYEGYHPPTNGPTKSATYEGYHPPTNGPTKSAVHEMYPSNDDQQNIIDPSSDNKINQPNNLIPQERPATYEGYHQPYNQPYGARRRITFRDLFRRKNHHKGGIPQNESNQPIENNTTNPANGENGNIEKNPNIKSNSLETSPKNSENSNSAGQDYQQPNVKSPYTEPNTDSSMESDKNINIEHNNLMQKKLEEEALAPIDTKHIPRPVYNDPNNISHEHLDVAKHKIHGIEKNSHNSTAHIKKIQTNNSPLENTTHDTNINTASEDIYKSSHTPYGPEDYTVGKSIPVETLANADDHVQNLHNTILENKNNNTRLENTELRTSNPGENNDFNNISSKDNISIENNSNLDYNLLENLNKIHQENIRYIFSRSMNAWEKIKNNPAESIWNIKKGSKEYTQLNNKEGKFFDYLHKLSDMTKIKPKSETLTMHAETNEEYIKRALVKAEEEGTINKIKLG